MFTVAQITVVIKVILLVFSMLAPNFLQWLHLNLIMVQYQSQDIDTDTLHVCCCKLSYHLVRVLLFFNIDCRERGRERERKKQTSICLLIHSLVDSYMCLDWESNPQPWHIRMMLEPIELPCQGQSFTFFF